MNMYRRVAVELHKLTMTLDESEWSFSPSGHCTPRSITHDTHAWGWQVPELVFVKGEEENLFPCKESKPSFSGHTDYPTWSHKFCLFIFMVLLTTTSVAPTIEHRVFEFMNAELAKSVEAVIAISQTLS
jgi:hypothetical protein